jgi:hypothetical protein
MKRFKGILRNDNQGQEGSLLSLRLVTFVCLLVTLLIYPHLGYCGPHLSRYVPLSCLGIIKENPGPSEETSQEYGHFLVQRHYGYSVEGPFTYEMGRAIKRVVRSLRQSIEANEPITYVELESYLNILAKTRSDIADSVEGNSKVAHLYGVLMPRTQEQLEIDNWRFPGQNFGNSLKDAYMRDWVWADKGRHRPFYGQINEAAKRRQGIAPEIEVLGRSVRLSLLIDYGAYARTLVVHPNFKDCEHLRKAALYRLMNALRREQITVREFFDEVAYAYSLLMHATPFLMGSPSIVESFLDAIVRAKFGLTFNPKRWEPFWSVMAEGLLTGEEFLRHFEP